MSTEARIREKCNALAEMLTAKNRAYGDSALRPVGVFSRGRASDLIRVRIDDKLSRIKNAPDAFREVPIRALFGYLILLQLAIVDESEDNQP